MQLKFYPKGSCVVRHPTAIQLIGAPANYIGRAKKQLDSGEVAYPASGEVFKCDSNSAVGRRLVKLLKRDDSLWAADSETAEHCGIDFLKLKLNDGEWVEDSTPAKKKILPRGQVKE